MIVNDFNVMKAVTIDHKADAILIVDPNAVLSLAITMEQLQMIRRRDSQILQTSRIVDHNQLAERDTLNGLWELLREDLMIDLFRFRICKAFNHSAIIHETRVYVKRIV